MGGGMGSNMRGTQWLQVYDTDGVGKDRQRGQGEVQLGRKAQTWGKMCMECWQNVWVRTGAAPGCMGGA